MIYLDNAATTYQKPPSVYEAMAKSYANPGRGGHFLSMQAGSKTFECRQKLAELFNTSRVENIVFTHNTTEALNLVIKGVLKKGDHVIISGMEHNSVVRPLKAMGISFSVATADAVGRVSKDVLKSISKKTQG